MMSGAENADVFVCGRCANFRRSGIVAGTCRYYNRAVYDNTACLASGKTEADLPHCQSCGKSIHPYPTAKSGSKYCAECWEVELQHRQDERLQWENRYLTLGLDLAAAANNGKPARSVAWCTWGWVRRQDKDDTGVVIGRALGGFAGAILAEALGASSGTGVVSHDATIGLLAVTDTELVGLDLGRCNFGSMPRVKVTHIQSRSHDEKALAAMKAVRFPLVAIRPKSADMSIEFDFEGKTRQFILADVPEIPHQPAAAVMLRALRAAGAPPPAGEFLQILLSGPPAFNAAFWQPAASNDSYWKDLNSAMSSAKLKTENVFTFLSAHAASIPELQADGRYVDLLWLLFEGLPAEQQEKLSRIWINPRPSFFDAFIEKARRMAQQPSTGWFAARKYKRLESILTGK